MVTPLALMPEEGAPSPPQPVRSAGGFCPNDGRVTLTPWDRLCGTARNTNRLVGPSGCVPSTFSRISPRARIWAGFSRSFSARLSDVFSAMNSGSLLGSRAMKVASMAKLRSTR